METVKVGRGPVTTNTARNNNIAFDVGQPSSHPEEIDKMATEGEEK